MNIWQTMEMIHSRSYTHIIKNIYPDPSVGLSMLSSLMKRFWNVQLVLLQHTMSSYRQHTWGDTGNQCGKNDFGKTHLLLSGNLKNLKRKLYRAVANVYILEGIRFYVSFACSFAFGENKLMEGNAKIISLIARDESQHMTITQNILNKWKQGDDP